MFQYCHEIIPVRVICLDMTEYTLIIISIVPLYHVHDMLLKSATVGLSI